jgi:hypothetical protein
MPPAPGPALATGSLRYPARFDAASARPLRSGRATLSEGGCGTPQPGAPLPQSRTAASTLFTRSASSVQTAADSRYRLTA